VVTGIKSFFKVTKDEKGVVFGVKCMSDMVEDE
jgi:hypothetical protein